MLDLSMELRHLRYFVAAAEAENVSRAALRLHVSQPALSRQIRDLESELGFPLFERSAKSVRLTEAGKAFLPEAQAVLGRVEEAVKTAKAAATGRRLELHVGYAPSPMARIMPPALRAFQKRFPNVKVSLHDLSTEEMLSRVREGVLQLAFLVQPSRAMLRGLHFSELARDPMCLAVAPDHPLARRRSVTLEQASREPLVVFSRAEYPEYFEYLQTSFRAIKAKPKIAEEHDSAASVIAAIESGCGVAIVAQSFTCSAGLRLNLIPFSPAPPPLVLGAVWARKDFGPMAQQFWTVARETASATLATGGVEG